MITDPIIIDRKARAVDALIIVGEDYNKLKVLTNTDVTKRLDKTDLKNDEFKDIILELVNHEVEFEKKFRKV